MVFKCLLCKEEFEESGDGEMHVAWKHGITLEEVMETVVACIQRLKRLGLN